MVLTATCPRCGNRFTSGVTIQDATFANNRQNIVMSCPRCGHEWDITGGSDGTWSTDSHGRLRLVEQLATASRSELEELREQVALIAQKQDQDAAAELTRSLGVEPTTKGRLTSGNEALDFVIKLSIVLGILLKGGAWTIDTVQQLVDQWFS